MNLRGGFLPRQLHILLHTMEKLLLGQIVFLCYDNALFSATLNIQIIYVNYVLLKVIFVKDVSSQFPLTEDNIYLCLQKYINQTNINVR